MGESFGEEWFREAFGRAWTEKAQEIGRFNLAIFGKTGVGKSTLVNAIFGEDVATTGIGEPVTTDEHLYLHTSGFLGVLDTRGVEVGVDNDVIIADLERYLAQMRQKPLADQIHVVWYCVRAMDRRFEETEADFIRQIATLGLPVILVLTQVPTNQSGPHPDATELAEKITKARLPIHDSRAFVTMARGDEFTGQPAHGLKELLDATFLAAPDGVESAISAAQKIDDERKQRTAMKTVEAAAAAAGAAGANPIPFSDAVILVPIQLGMMAKIANVYGVGFETATMASLAATAGATTAGRAMAGSMLKLIPGVGTVVGGTITGGVAATLTYSMGRAWIMVCARIASGGLRGVGGALETEAVRKAFVEEFRKQFSKRIKGGR